MNKLPPGPFRIIVADPPWQFRSHASRSHGDVASRAAVAHYPVMRMADITNIPVETIADRDGAILFLWCVGAMMPEALNVMRAWNFDYVSQMVWVKPSIGLGHWVRTQHELILIGRRGKVPPPAPPDRRSSVIHAPRRRHSEKPEDLQDWIDSAYPDVDKIELFARRRREGWAAWGNDIDA